MKVYESTGVEKTAASSPTDVAAFHDNVTGEFTALGDKASPVGADILLIEDSADSDNKKKVSISNLPGGADADAIHDNVSGEINAIANKATPVGADEILIEDSADSFSKKKTPISALPASTPAADSITNTELANMIEDAIKGRANGGGTGDPQDLTPTQVRTILGVEAGSTADQTNAEIRTAVEAATDSNVFNDADHTKLNAIESAATADQTGAEIKTAYDGENFVANSMLGNNTGAPAGPIELTATQVRALLGIEAGSTADQSDTEIRDAVEAATDSNTFNDADHTKLGGIATGATVGDDDAIHDNVASEISAIAVKGTPAGGDFLIIEDSAAANVKKHILISSLPAGSPAPDSITNTELANMVEDAIKGRANGGGTGDPQDLTPTQVRTIIGVEAGSTADQTDAEIRTAVEAATDSNVFNDADHTRLNGIETAATADQTAGEIEAIVSHDNLQNIQADEHVPSGTAETLANKDLTATSNRLRLENGKSLEDPTSSENRFLFYTRKAITITEWGAVLVGSATPTVTYQVFHSLNRDGSGTENALTTSAAVTSVTTLTGATLSDATIPADSHVYFKTTAKGGTVGEIAFGYRWTED